MRSAVAGHRSNSAAPLEDIPSLTGLRFLAAIAVAMAHGANLILTKSDSLLGLKTALSTCAGFGMTLFFVLSGFVIHYNYRTVVAERGMAGVRQFLWARMARLYPLFLLMLLVDIVLGRALFSAASGDTTRLQETLTALPYFLLFVQSWTYAVIGGNSLIYQIGSNAPVTWSISTEWFFYAVYPLLCIGLIKVKRPSILGAVVVVWSLGVCIVTSHVFNQLPRIDAWAGERFGPVAVYVSSSQDSLFRWLLYFSPYSRIGEFVLGCLTAQLFEALRTRPIGLVEERVASVAVYAAAASIPLFLYLIYAPGGPAVLRRLNFNFGLAPNVAVLIFLCARYKSSFASWLSKPLMVRMGEASYSIYLIHLLVFTAAAGIGSPSSGIFSDAYLIIRYVFLLCCLVLISSGLYAVFEAPARRWLRSLPHSRHKNANKLVMLIAGAPLMLAAGAYLLNAGITLSNKRADSNPDRGIAIRYATYGQNCGAPAGNASRHVSNACDGLTSCAYKVDVNRLGDPANGCGKNFSVTYACLPDSKNITVELPAEAGLGSMANLICGQPGK